jgi:hypothetical protein
MSSGGRHRPSPTSSSHTKPILDSPPFQTLLLEFIVEHEELDWVVLFLGLAIILLVTRVYCSRFF